MIKGPVGPRGPYNSKEDRLSNEDLFPSVSEHLPGVHPDYANLPVSIQSQISPKDYLWLDDEGKRNLTHDFTMPEVGDD